MVIQHNLQAMNANRMVGISSKTVSESVEKLSSGYRINRAANDAAGLAISEKMRKQIRGLDRASTNAEDGISCVQTAEGAMSEIQEMLQRMNELCVQAANGTNSVSDRQYIQDEVDQLISEIDRVAQTTIFNENYLLQGNSENIKSSYITNYVVTYARNELAMNDLSAVPYKVNYEGEGNIYIATIDSMNKNAVIMSEEIKKGQDITNYLYHSNNANNNAEAIFRSDKYVAFYNAELNSALAVGNNGNVSGVAGYDLSTNGIDSKVRANRELFVYDTEVKTIIKLNAGDEMSKYLNDDNTVNNRYRYIDKVYTDTQNLNSVTTPTVLSDADYPGGTIQTVDTISLNNYSSYTDGNGKTHYVLGNGTFSIDSGLTGLVFDVSGNVNIENTNLQNVNIQCRTGTNLSLKNVIIDNSANNSQSGNGVGNAISFLDGNGIINCYGNNTLNGGVDNYIFSTDNVYLAGCGIGLVNDASITINGTDTSVLTVHGSTTNLNGKYYTGAGIGAVSNNSYTWSVTKNSKIIVNSGTINAFANKDETIYATPGSCSLGGSGISTINVHGGKLNAYGGQYALRPRTASGMTDTPTVNIYAGNVNITGTYGIGTDGRVPGNINISGGNIDINTQSSGIFLPANGISLFVDGGNINIASSQDEAINTTYWNHVYLRGGNLTALSPVNRPVIGYHSATNTMSVYADGVLTDGTGVDDGAGHHVFEYVGGVNKNDNHKDFWEDVLKKECISTQLYDSDGNKVSAIALNKYFDENGKYKGGLFTTSQARSVDEVFINSNNHIGGKTHAIEMYVTQNTINYADNLNIDLQVGADSDRTNKINLDIKSMNASSIKIDKLASWFIGIVDDTGEKATDAIDVITEALTKVSTQRAALGAIQNRLEHTIRNLDNVVENTISAESQIRDTNMAEEMVKYSNTKILQQAGQSMLAQANQINQDVLSLLQ